MAFTTFDAGQGTNWTLDASKLVATSSSAAGGTVRAADWQSTGKFYWEVTVNSVSSIGALFLGIVRSDFPVGPNASPTTAGQNIAARDSPFSTVYLNGGSLGTYGTGYAVGATVCIAVDLGAGLFWFRPSSTANWNGSASANPATGAGGYSFASALGTLFPWYPAAIVSIVGATDKVTANFGASAFAGAVPSGFTAGWPTNTAAITSAVVTNAQLEAWTTLPSAARVTQAQLEVWFGANSRAIVSQASFEVWRSVADYVAPPVTAVPFVCIMA